jgi:hypothetical protein
MDSEFPEFSAFLFFGFFFSHIFLIASAIRHILHNPALDRGDKILQIFICLSGFWAIVYYLRYMLRDNNNQSA